MKREKFNVENAPASLASLKDGEGGIPLSVPTFATQHPQWDMEEVRGLWLFTHRVLSQALGNGLSSYFESLRKVPALSFLNPEAVWYHSQGLVC